MANKAKANIRLRIIGYRGAAQRPCCSRCPQSSVKPYSQGHGGKVVHCATHKAVVASFGICPNYTGPTFEELVESTK